MKRNTLVIFGVGPTSFCFSDYNEVVRVSSSESILGLDGEGMDIYFTYGWWSISRSNLIMKNLLIYIFAYNARILGEEYVPPYLFKTYEEGRDKKTNTVMPQPIYDRFEILDL